MKVESGKGKDIFLSRVSVFIYPLNSNAAGAGSQGEFAGEWGWSQQEGTATDGISWMKICKRLIDRKRVRGYNISWIIIMSKLCHFLGMLREKSVNRAKEPE